MNSPFFSPTTKALFAGVFAVCLAATAGADTYYWKNSSSATDYKLWDEVDPNDGTYVNWSTESTTGANASALPGTSDSVKQAGVAYDLNGGNWTIGTFGATANWQGFSVQNGTLTVSKQYYGQYGTHRWNGVHLIVPVGSEARTGASDANPTAWNLSNGTVFDLLGKMNAFHTRVNIDASSTLNFDPTSYATDGGSSRYDEWKNNGTFNLPHGMKMTSGSLECKILQQGGTLTLGGNLVANGHVFTFTWSGGTVHVVDDAELDGVTATISSSVTLNVDSGARFTLPATTTFASGITLTKTGAGDVLFAGFTLPSAVSVNAGGLVLDASGTYDLSPVTFALGSSLKIGAGGITLSDWNASLADASFAVADGYIPANGATVLTIADATLLAQAQTGLNASLAGTGMTVAINGNSLVAEAHYTFSSATVTDLNDANGWDGGIAAPAGQPVTISGASTVAIMDGQVPAYSSISVTNGATLTVTETRVIPAATFTAGTALHVTSGVSRVEMESRAYNGHILNTDTLVGTMAPSQGIAGITNIAGNLSGGWFGSHVGRPYTQIDSKVLENGAKLRVQFKVFDDKYVKCAIVEFTKDDAGNIYAKGVAAGYIETTNLAVDFDSATYTSATYATSDSSGAYGVKELSFMAPVVYGGPSTVTAVGDFVTTGSGSVTVNVAADCVLDLSGVDVATAATLVKTGDGAIVFGDKLPSALNVTEGILVLQPYVEYDMTAVTIAGGVTIKVAVDGEHLPCIATPGQNGTTVYMTGDTYVGVGGWDTLANWASGAVPSASATVHIYGTNTVLTLDSVPATMPASIVVEGGATLVFATDVTPPMLTLDKEATLEIASGTTTLANSPVGIVLVDGDDVTLPSLIVRDGAVLSVPGNMKFANVDISLYGTISVSTVGTLTFGHAPLDETTYIGLYAEGAKIRLSSSGSNYDVRRIGICCPEVGGCVVAVRDIVFKDMPTIGTHFPSYDYPDGFHLGVNNPADEAFEVVFDNTKWGVDGNFYVWGGATFRMKNGSSFMNREDYGYYNRHAGVKENGRIIVGAGCELRLNAMGNGGVTPFDVTVQETGHKAVTVADGGIFETFRWSGNNKGVFASSNGVVRIYNPRYDHAVNNWHYVNILFDKLSAIALAPDSLLTFTTRNGSNSNGFKDASGPRVVAMADVPITGNGGSITLSNANVNAFGVVVRSASNTATGTAGVSPAEAGIGDTTLYFASGANWAGTVVAGDVALTNLTDGAAAAMVNFEALDLAGDFPVRVWKENGVITSDTVNVGQYVNHGGKLVPALLSDGASFVPGDKITVGTIDASSPLPATGRGWRCKLVDNGLDNDTKTLILSNSRGLQIMLQ